ncbi:aldose epimerase family protein [Hymenobacter sp. CRA2]|uniref:aldose epimerase family protein n=1 Tax=Hymenobacter sp. CRA2 TaxID=1955620 RepID=UPI00098F353B|nr:aldose epimerase family protein [Hymenobacter sp. CRA2]OON69922.1 galactose mutarotase [Hymenobacter sp. CRA2]
MAFPSHPVLRSGSLVGLLLCAACSQNKSESAAAEAPVAQSAPADSSAAGSFAKVAGGRTQEGEEVNYFTLRNAHGLQATITNYGGTLTKLLVPDKAGQLGDIVLGFDSVSGYQSPAFLKANPYFGALIGRYGNRIAGGRFTLDGKTYQLAQNDGQNHLHGGKRGYDKVVWQAAAEDVSATDPGLTLTYRSNDGEEGYPGTLEVQVRYTLTHDDVLRIEYTAKTDKSTPVNLTQHSYFNLNPAGADVLGHQLTLAADRYTVVGAGLIPTGELRAVQGTPFDFRQAHTFGERIAQVPGGYDHNWALNGAGTREAATVYEPTSGRTLTVVTDQPGLQVYTGNFLDGSIRGKGGKQYGKYAGFCLETQHFPDSPNQPKFPSTTLRPGETYHTVTEYRFGVRK